ncbi:DUF3883 domain-containing protein [Micromonospora sp. NPDC049107]|uniref:DUF3883 domain-containing protein n=1 Tax=Micromonospora sp. NPDC049107 TaxID=3154349 RepID=UPI00340B3A33
MAFDGLATAWDGLETAWRILAAAVSHVDGRLYAVRMTDDDGRVLNAEFVVEADGQGLALVLESAGGQSAAGLTRNSDYTPALELLLARLRSRGAVLVDALVDSKRTAHLSEADRRVLDGRMSLVAVDDLAALRLQLTSRQGRIGQSPDAPKAGNNRKRLRLRLQVPGYGPGDARRLSADLAGGSSLPHTPRGRSSTVPPQPRRHAVSGAIRLNEWWRDDPAECYWLEITDRDDLGANVQALQRDGSGRENWSYVLVTALRPGDVVVHWHKTQRQMPGIVGYSFAAEGPFEDELVWQARGTYGQARPTVEAPQPSWRYELADYTALPTPVDQLAFQRSEKALREIKQKLEAEHSGPLYFPFAFYDSRPARVMQAYLVKFPAAILDAVPELAGIPRRRVPQEPGPAGGTGRRRAQRASGSGYIADPLLRRALERHAVREASALYKGWTVEDVGDRESYDLRVIRDAEEIHIEVKGSSGTADAVELTRNEVRHALGAVTHLVVVDQIKWSRSQTGEITTSGGRVRRWGAWVPEDEDLVPTRYRYRLPDSGADLVI